MDVTLFVTEAPVASELSSLRSVARCSTVKPVEAVASEAMVPPA